MKPIAAMILAGTLGTSSAVFAASFDGFYVGAGLGLRGTSSKVTESSTATEIDGIGKNDVFGTVLAGYSWSPNGVFNIAANVWYDFGDNKTTVTTSGLTGDFKLKDTYGLSIEPGWYMGTNTLGYLKLSYARTKLEVSVSGLGSASENFDGFGYGVGIKHLVTPNVYLFVEAEQRPYNSKTFNSVDVKPTETLGTFGVGFKF
jgi:opacity protein-like surface antigen